ncbi:hypothetical protein [Aestuariimicrobium ganziense]|uniref:hypothetical protein n=1 Tax=Aestuariimicrobium ganziense TaxID=2773677 RepID=UPI001942F004|nr:hypothetical protein [Aestuariimicrobium ganziense]
MDDLEPIRASGGFVDEPESDQRRAGAPQRRPVGHRLAWTTAGLAAALLVGVVAGATGRAPRTVEGPTVTVTATSDPVETAYGQSTREQVSQMETILPGVHLVGQGAPIGTWRGVPFAAGEMCHWQRVQTDRFGRTLIVAEVLTNSITRVRIQPEDARFVSYGCRWVREE